MKHFIIINIIERAEAERGFKWEQSTKITEQDFFVI